MSTVNLMQFSLNETSLGGKVCHIGKNCTKFSGSDTIRGTCVTQVMSRSLTDIPSVTHFPLVTQIFSAKKSVTQGKSNITVQYFNFSLTYMNFRY